MEFSIAALGVEPSITVALLGFLGVVVTAMCGVAIAVITNRREPIPDSALELEIEELHEENAALRKTISILLGEMEKKP